MSAKTSTDATETRPLRTPDAVRLMIEELYPQEESRVEILSLLGESIEKAHDTNPASWSLALDAGHRRLRLHVGRMFALSFQPGDIAVTMVDDGLSAPTHAKGITGEIAGAFRSLPGVLWHRLDPAGLLEQWPELRSAHLDAVERGAKQVRRTSYLLFHDPEALDAVGALLDRDMPAPEHGLVEPATADTGERPAAKGWSGAKQRELRSLLGELLDGFLSTREGTRLIERYRRTRGDALERFRRTLETERRGDEVADAVFRGLLPHADTDENARLEAWIWPGAGLPGDTLGWLMERHGSRPEDGPRIATAALDFIRQSIEDPSSLPDICRGFASLPYTRGLDSALLSPALAALRPEEFLALDHRTRRVINYFAGTRFSRDLNDYPMANSTGRELLQRFEDELQIAQTFGILPSDLFHLLAQWLTRIVKHPLGAGRCWWVRTGGDEEEWRSALRSGFVSLDEGLALGDLSKLSRHEFDQRRTELGEPDDALWTFSREIEEGDHVVAGRAGQVAAVGTVSGPYGFSRGAASGHFLPVEWDDIEPRVPNAKLPPGVLSELDPSTFEALTGPATAAQDATTPQPARKAGGAGRTAVQASAPPTLSLERVATATSLEVTELEHWMAILRRRRQAVFQGPSGTGKTFLARQLAQHLVSGGPGALEILPLHPAVSYADLLGEPGEAAGRLAELCRRAAELGGTSVLVLDDLQRLDPAALGEALYLLEHRGEEVTLAHGGRLTVPAEVLVLGTWTTSPTTPPPEPAFVRRFAFLPLPPRYDVLERFHQGGGGTETRRGFARRIATVLRAINAEIDDPRAHLGITPLLDRQLPVLLPDVWTTEIEPLLEERFRDRSETLERFRWQRLRREFEPAAMEDASPEGADA